VKIYYKKPDKVHVDSRDGLAILPKNGLMTSNPAKQFISADELSITGSACIDGRNCYVILANFTKGDRPVESRVWIDKKDWLVMRISANPGYGPSVDVELKYIEVEGKYWLPVYTKAKLSIPLMSRRHGNIEPGAPQSSTAIIRFSNYKVNKGISDSVFIEKPERGN
jgi:outer membrane lipoprotein-sorting protein